VRTVLCEDAHKMHAACRRRRRRECVADLRDSCAGCGTGTGGNGLSNHMYGPLQNGWQVETDSRVTLRGRSARRAPRAVHGAADALGCRFRQRERKVHVRTSELRRVLVATEGHGIVAMHAWTDIGVMGVSEAAQGPRAIRWDAFRFSRLLVIRPESTPSRS